MDMSKMLTVARRVAVWNLAIPGLILWPLWATADSGQVTVRTDGAMDGTYALAPCEPDIPYCGTVIDAEPLYIRRDDDTGAVPNPTSPVSAALIGGPSAAGTVGTGNAIASASASALRGYVDAVATGGWYHLRYRDEFGETQSLDFFRGSKGAAEANAIYRDEVVLAGPAGVVGTFNLVLTFDRLFLPNGVNVGGSATAQVGFSPMTPSGPASALALIAISDCSNCANPLTTRMQSFQAMAGTAGVLTQLLMMNATASASTSSVSNGIRIYANNTMNVYLEPLTPGFTVSSASGYSYAVAAVPEPSTAAMFVGGLALMAVARGLRRRARA